MTDSSAPKKPVSGPLRPGQFRAGRAPLSSLAAGALLLTLLAGSGCVQRTLVITSDPPGAKVTINQTDIGATPLTYRFKTYGTFDIRLSQPGYYPLHVAEPVAAPFHQQPFIDFGSDVLLPVRIKDVRELHYELEKIEEEDDIKAVLARGDEMRANVERMAKKRLERDQGRKHITLPLRTKKEVQKGKKKEAEKEKEKPE